MLRRLVIMTNTANSRFYSDPANLYRVKCSKLKDGSMAYKVFLVEDEIVTREGIRYNVDWQTNGFEFCGEATDGEMALPLLRASQPDVIITDIKMPFMDGLQLSKIVRENMPWVKIIILSGHDEFEYAQRAINVGVTDYLLKPVEFSRFLAAVNKLKQPAAKETSLPAPSQTGSRPYLFFNVSKKKVKVYLDEILYIESLKEYIRIFTKTKSILTKFQLGQIEELLAKNNFLRVHRSFIVAKDKIDAFSATDVEVNGKQIPVGRSYKELVQSVLDSPAGQ